MSHKYIAASTPETNPGIDLENALNTYLEHSPEHEKTERHTVAKKIRKMGTLRPTNLVNLPFFNKITSLPDRFQPQATVYLHGCTSLTALPSGFTPQGDVDLSGCTSLTTIPDSLFQMPPTATVTLRNTGLNAQAVETMSQRINTPGYNGPRFLLNGHPSPLSAANSGYRQEDITTADTLPSINEALKTEKVEIDLNPGNRLSELKLKAQNTPASMALQTLADTLKPLIEAFNTNNQPYFGYHPINNDLKKMRLLLPVLFEKSSSELTQLNTPKKRKAPLNELLAETNRTNSSANLTTTRRDRALAKVIVSFLVQVRETAPEALTPIECNKISTQSAIPLSL